MLSTWWRATTRRRPSRSGKRRSAVSPGMRFARAAAQGSARGRPAPTRPPRASAPPPIACDLPAIDAAVQLHAQLPRAAPACTRRALRWRCRTARPRRPAKRIEKLAGLLLAVRRGRPSVAPRRSSKSTPALTTLLGRPLGAARIVGLPEVGERLVDCAEAWRARASEARRAATSRHNARMARSPTRRPRASRLVDVTSRRRGRQSPSRNVPSSATENCRPT